MHHPLQNEYNIITGLGNPCVKIQRQICTRTKALPLAHAQPLFVVKVADVLIDVVLGVDTVVEGEAGSFAVKMRNDNQMAKLYVIIFFKFMVYIYGCNFMYQGLGWFRQWW